MKSKERREDLNPTKQGLLHVAIAWGLIICYSIFMVSAVESIIGLSPVTPPNDGIKQIVIFIYGLAVVSFMGGSQIPAVFMKKKSFTVQFVFSALFGFILLLVTILNESAFSQFNDFTLIPFFSTYRFIALEYLSIPYLFMVFLDLYLHGRLGTFSWKDFHQYLTGVFLHPWQTFEDVFFRRSVLFSLVSVVLVGVMWILRDLVLLLQPGFAPARWCLVPLGIGGTSDPIFRASFMIPVGLSSWLIGSGLAHLVAEQLGGEGSYLDVASLLGLSFLPSSMIIAVDTLELGVASFGIPKILFQILSFVPLVLWPLILAVLTTKTSKNLSIPKAILPAITATLPVASLAVIGFL